MSSTPNFDRLARLYRWMEYFSLGPWLALTRRTYLAELGNFRHALVMGDGDGRFTAALLRANPLIHIHAVDCSHAMLASLLRRAGPHAARVRLQQTDLRTWQPQASEQPQSPGSSTTYDLVVTHFFLDCLTTAQIDRLAASLRPVLAPNAHWLVSEFAVPPGWFGRLVAHPLVASLYWAFGWLTGLGVRALPDHRAALEGAGFILSRQRTRLHGLLASEFWRRAI